MTKTTECVFSCSYALYCKPSSIFVLKLSVLLAAVGSTKLNQLEKVLYISTFAQVVARGTIVLADVDYPPVGSQQSSQVFVVNSKMVPNARIVAY